MNAPLYESLLDLSRQNPLRLHMPGHKGRMTDVFSDISSIDFTEIDPTGNLYTCKGPIALAEDLCAKLVAARDALFFTCGSTQGIFTMLSAAVGMGGSLILDRCCHKSVYHGMGLLDITPHYLFPEMDPQTGLSVPVSPELLAEALDAHPEAKAVFLTSPSYYGVRTELKPLADLCHKKNVYLLVDEAHGAHFPFVDVPSAMEQGADLAVVSTHKTWPALGSSSILYVSESAPWSKLQLKSMSAVFATTSPSYPILASIDYARAKLETEAGSAYRNTARLTAKLRDAINRETCFHALTETDGLSLDPCRLTVDVGGLTGWEADRLLQKQNIYLEMADERYIVAILTCNDTPADFQRLLSDVKSLPQTVGTSAPALSPPNPMIKTSIRQGLFGPQKYLPLREAAGKISAEILAPYPPGIPIVAPGEEITEKHIAYLQKKSYNIDKATPVLL